MATTVQQRTTPCGQGQRPRQTSRRSTRNVAEQDDSPQTRTQAQRERKRLQDRESQRNVRQRTRHYIASLETRLAEMAASSCHTKLIQENAELRSKIERLETTLQSISELASRSSPPPVVAGGHDIRGPLQRKRSVTTDQSDKPNKRARQQTQQVATTSLIDVRDGSTPTRDAFPPVLTPNHDNTAYIDQYDTAGAFGHILDISSPYFNVFFDQDNHEILAESVENGRRPIRP